MCRGGWPLTIRDGELRRLSQGNSEDVVPSWSKDGESIYFSSNRSGQHQVWKMPFQGGDPVQVTRGAGFGPIESPDGQFIYYARSRTAPGLLRMLKATGEETLVLDTLKPAFWGLWVAAVEGIYFLDFGPTGRPPCELKFLDLRTGLVSELAVLTGLNIVHYQGLAVSADRQRILYPQLEPSAGEIMLARTLQ